MLNPNFASAWYFSGYVRVFLGDPELGIAHFAHTMRLSPLDPLIFNAQSGTAFAHFYAGRCDEARSWAERALQENPNSYPALRISAASNALLGRMGDAQKAMARLRQIDPALRIADLKNLVPRRRPEDLAKFTEGLRIAGLPD